MRSKYSEPPWDIPRVADAGSAVRATSVRSIRRRRYHRRGSTPHDSGGILRGMKPQMFVIPALVVAAGTASAKGLTIDDMLAMQRVGDPEVSPGGKLVAFAVRDTDVDANRGRFDIWLAAVDGSFVRRLTTSPDNDHDPAWTPDGRWVYFLSSRGGSDQVWRISPSGGEAE